MSIVGEVTVYVPPNDGTQGVPSLLSGRIKDHYEAHDQSNAVTGGEGGRMAG